MIPPRNFPSGILKLVEYDGNNPVRTIAELSSSSKNRLKMQQMRNDLLMASPKLNLQIRENNA
jgi:hypothetical protein